MKLLTKTEKRTAEKRADRQRRKERRQALDEERRVRDDALRAITREEQHRIAAVQARANAKREAVWRAWRKVVEDHKEGR